MQLVRWTFVCLCPLLPVAPGAAAAEPAEISGEISEETAGDITGKVKDKDGGALVGATVTVLTPQRAVVATTMTDASGTFKVSGLVDGQYLVTVKYPGFAERQASATVSATATNLDLTLDMTGLGENVTVTANPGGLGDISRVTQPINQITAEEVLLRARTVVAQVVEGETGVNLQRTSPGMAGIFVRGLTGNKVNIFVDGVRYSNGAQRGGVNTFLDLIDPSALTSVEILRGTSSAQYGSDALGGSVQFLTEVPKLSTGAGSAYNGSFIVGGEAGGHPGGFGTGVIGYAGSKFGLRGSFSGRKTGDYNPGTDNDSHAAVTRFLGMDSIDFYGDKMADTGFHQTAAQVRANVMLSNNLVFVANYMSTRQDGANRWDQILGGDGNLIAELNDLQLDLAYGRIEALSAGWFDHASVTYSFNTQREERVNQGGQGSSTALIGHEPERTTVNGLQFSLNKGLNARTSLLLGGDSYFEKLTSDAFDVNPVTGVVTDRRPRVPDQATYKQGGLFAQVTWEAVPDKVSLVGAARFGYNAYEAKASDAPPFNGSPMWPDDSLTTKSGTYRLGGAFRVTSDLTFTAAVSTGYRAPHMTDLGTLGLTGSGFEVAAPDVAGLNGFVGTTADATAVATDMAVAQVEPETSVNYDLGLRYRNSRAKAEFTYFINNIDGNIQKQSLILPQGAVGISLGGTPITSQNANGVVFVQASANPVLVRANFDEARVWGIEWLGEFSLNKSMTVGTTYTYMEARDLNTDLPPNIEGGTPAPFGTVWLRYAKDGQPWWVEPYFTFAQEQKNLSTLDLGDRRTGANRTRGQIQNFFRNGARNRGWVDAGPDGIINNADDRLIETGETLLQVQDRVLGVGVNSAPLFTSVASYSLFGIRFGWTQGRHAVLIDASNLGDENYRGISWGMDGPGRMITARYTIRY
jgi:outer membrane receptor protein involved in Fe transport